MVRWQQCPAAEIANVDVTTDRHQPESCRHLALSHSRGQIDGGLEGFLVPELEGAPVHAKRVLVLQDVMRFERIIRIEILEAHQRTRLVGADGQLRQMDRSDTLADDLQYTLDNLDKLVVKEVHGAGGYGMLVGPASTAAEIADFRRRLIAKPHGYISQPTLALSACPTYVESGIAPRHIDLRPFVLSGKTVTMVPGGLTRVALKEGSLVVNSSQGGGTKDTWILEE